MRESRLKSSFPFGFALRNLCVLCVSAVYLLLPIHSTAETQRLRRDLSFDLNLKHSRPELACYEKLIVSLVVGDAIQNRFLVL